MKPPHIKAQQQKEFRRIQKRIQVLYREINDLGYIQLEKPIRKGWYKEIKITENVNRYKNRKAILEVFEKIQSFRWGATKEKAQQAWDNERAKYMLAKDKPTISRKSYNKLSEKAKSLCVLFQYKDPYSHKYKKRFYVNLPQGCTQLKFSRAYITHRRRIDPSLESELKYLSNQLVKTGFYELNSSGIWHRWNRIVKTSEKKKETRKIAEKLKSFQGRIATNDFEL